MQRFQTPIDMRGNQILNLRVENVASLPAAGSAGRIVYLTTDGLIYTDNGTAWVPVVMSGGDATGGFMRFASGTQICWGVAASASDGLGAVETLPAAFANTNYSVSLTVNANFPRMVAAFDKTTTTFRAQAYTAAGAASTINSEYTAVGDWF